MKFYDPLTAPDPAAWRALPEDNRIALVAACQRQAGVKTRLPDAHTILHVTVENQIADAARVPVRRAIDRIMAQGLDRHEAIHAVGSVLMGFMHDMLANPQPAGFPTEAYVAALDRLTADLVRKGTA